MLDPDLREALRQGLEGSPDWLEVRTRLQRLAREGSEERYRPFIFAFGYDLVERSQRARRERSDGPFAPMMSDGDWSFPPDLDEIHDVDVDAWRAATEAIQDPVSDARLHDLLWERRVQPRPDMHARAAAAALLRLGELQHWHPMTRSVCISRALELANSVKDGELRARAVADAVAFIETVVAAEERGPGAALTLLRSLVDLRRDQRPGELDALLAAAIERYGDEPQLFDSLAELRVRLGDRDEGEALRREQVQRWRSAAGEGDPMLRLFRLEQALEVARTHGLSDLADEIRQELQDIRPEDLDLKSVSATLAIPSDEVREWIDSIAGQPSWQEALRHLGSERPPGGSTEELDEQLASEREQFPILQLFTRSVTGPDTAASRFRAVDAESRERLERAERRAWYARMMSPFYIDALRSIEQRHGRPHHEDLSAFFATDLIGPQRGERMARALELFWDDQPDESAHVLVPRLESTVREIARRVGLTVIREPVGEEPGGARSLGTLLLELRTGFPDPTWQEYLFNLLADPLGLNLRNTIAHGLRDATSAGDSALLLHAALFLRLLGVSPVAPAADAG